MATFRSLLCAEKWWWDSAAESYIQFHEDGTGDLVARRELCLFIAAHFNWEAQQPDFSNNEIDVASSWLQTWQPHNIGQIDIKMTLTTRRIQLGEMDMQRFQINEDRLTEEAFLPQKLSLRLEKGRFMTVNDAQFVSELPYYQTFHYRLSCDPSPFPVQDMWKSPGGAPEQLRFWEWKQFHSHERSLQSQMTPWGKVFNTCKRAIGLD
ncbi:hypothetical protein ASPVEDRAFT_89146 [Aspergillus versicolor CBS 583.65]|uniref:Uncharacterized protein n=1 Tax=Aspergillus versicolor CBS 583.65 TaxID=1036611 RepID=A0A1L9Q2C8_ASPVE|nr:uncharacterized protein ASPVEDRAFT_89146 [Aspergillus versicolor CBS 583.65]OJJ07913.1 hypothetical protein ASPVEDRAFT_89146 [Aspergillus versicolor CBS 583.65]